MIRVNAPQFDIQECRNEAEQVFIETLHERAWRARWHADSWPRDDRIIITVDIADPEYKAILTMLRVDFNGSTMIAGRDETMQLATDLDPNAPDNFSLTMEEPNVLAEKGADWLEREMSRAIERLEWTRPGFKTRLWRYADTKTNLVVSDSENTQRKNLGPPDKVVVVKTG